MFSILFFGLVSGHILLDIIVGLFGSRREIGFGWAFIISFFFTPLIGLIAVLLSNTLPNGVSPRYGCLGETFGCLGSILLALICVALLAGALLLLFPTI